MLHLRFCIDASRMEAMLDCMIVDDSNDDSSSRGVDPPIRGSRVDLILDDITQALDSWTHRITVLENELRSNTNVKNNIIDSLQRQVWDGLISQGEADELKYILDLWTKLHSSYVCRQLGAEFSDREVIDTLLELFSLKQITKSFFIRITLQLCRLENGC